jgi:hypothetical protein
VVEVQRRVEENVGEGEGVEETHCPFSLLLAWLVCFVGRFWGRDTTELWLATLSFSRIHRLFSRSPGFRFFVHIHMVRLFVGPHEAGGIR